MTAPTAHPPSKGSTDRWDNEGGQIRPETPSPDDLQVELELYGIVPVQLTVFDWGGYRYSNSSDAIAAAKRQSKSA
jgi:hypothetical protein